MAPRRKHSDEDIIADARLYSTVKGWTEASRYFVKAAHTRGIYQQATAHMVRAPKPKGAYGPQKNPYKGPRDWFTGRKRKEYQIPAFKECNDCGDTMPLAMFHKHPQPRDGRMGHCKSCHEIRQDKRLNTVSWADKKAIREVYAERDRLNALGGERYVVDHIIPCSGELVSGLHVASNLRVVTAKENATKYNKWTCL